MPQSQLCSVTQLRSIIQDNAVKVIDSSWYLPSQQVDVVGDYHQQHIIGAQFFHIDEVCDQDSNLPHMLPSEAGFADAVGKLGITNDDTVVVYDSAGLFSAARVWWMFKVFGHDNVQVLDGGLPAWIEAGGELGNAQEKIEPKLYNARLQTSLVVEKAELIENCSSKEYVVLDARSTERFLGKAPEPRTGLPSGHMPESISFPFNQLIENGKLKSPEQLRALFTKEGVDETSVVITSCGSGVTAAIITLALAECGYGLKRLYDGSWAEWGAAGDTTILNRALAESV